LPTRAGRFGVVIESDRDPLEQVEGLFLPPPVSIREVRAGGPAKLRSIRQSIRATRLRNAKAQQRRGLQER
jgi:hypothetical protein